MCVCVYSDVYNYVCVICVTCVLYVHVIYVFDVYVCDNIHVLSSSASFKVNIIYTIKYQHDILSLFNLCCLYITDQRQV